MNIKIAQRFWPDMVQATFPFGSRVYGNATDASDWDFLNITNCNTGDVILQFQDLESKIDHIYTDMAAFLRDMENGGSAINFEVMHLKEFQERYPIDPLKFYTYKMAKCYLGLAKRDAEHHERLFHANRCLFIADKIMKKELIVVEDLGKISIEWNSDKLQKAIKDKRAELQKANGYA